MLKKNIIIVMVTIWSSVVYGQNYTVTGVVKDASGIPLPGVTVKHTTQGVLTDIEGRYSISVEGEQTLSFSLVGYAPQSIVLSSGGIHNIVMRDDLLNLNEIVVTGTSVGTSRKQLGNTISTLSGSDVNQSANVSVGGALQGKVAGAQISQSSGSPAGGISVRLRGPSTVNGSSEPLYIIDGVIVNNQSDQLIGLGGYSQNRLVDINPKDIARIEIIKGASASAIYGARASNGVVQIFTKKGELGKSEVTFSTSLKVNTLREQLPYNQVGKVWDEDMDMAVSNYPAKTVDYLGNDVSGQSVQRYNYQDDIYTIGVGTENYVSVSGGRNKTRYFTSIGQLYNQGIIKNTDFNRYNFRGRIDQRLSDVLSFSLGSTYSKSISQDLPNGYDGIGVGPLTAWIFLDNAHPGVPQDESYPKIEPWGNPYESIDRLDFRQSTVRSITDAQLKIIPATGLVIDYVLGVDFSASEGREYVPKGFGSLLLGRSRQVMLNRNLINNDLSVKYKRDIGDIFTFTTSLGGSFQYEESQQLVISASNLLGGVPSTNSGTLDSRGDYFSQRSIYGVFLQETVGVNEKLHLTASIRTDQSSAFGASGFQLYPKVSGSYAISDESFWSDSKINDYISFFKIRSSWGKAGNMTGVGAYDRFTSYAIIPTNGESGIYSPSRLGNSDIKPETQTEWEVGADMAFLDGTIGFEVSYYRQDIEDLLLSRNLAPSTGFGSRIENVGNMTNEGLELMGRFFIYNRSDFRWSATLIYSRNVNMVTSVAGDQFTLGSLSVVKEGEALGVFWGGYFARNEDGSLLLTPDGLPQREKGVVVEGVNVHRRGVDGQPIGDDLNKVIGSPHPDFTGSISTELNYKNFTLSILFDGSFGADVASWDKRMSFRFPSGIHYGEELLGNVPKGYYGNQFSIFESFIEDGSYVKLRNLSLSYNFSPNIKGVSDVRLAATGTNLLLFSNYWGLDPEVNSFGQSNGVRGMDMATVPLPRSFELSLQVKF